MGEIHNVATSGVVLLRLPALDGIEVVVTDDRDCVPVEWRDRWILTRDQFRCILDVARSSGVEAARRIAVVACEFRDGGRWPQVISNESCVRGDSCSTGRVRGSHQVSNHTGDIPPGWES